MTAESQFFDAVINDDRKGVKIATNGGARVNARDRANNTALIIACEHGFESVVDFLLQYDAPRVLPNPKDNYGDTALMKACRAGNHKIVKMLLDNFGDIKLDAVNTNNETAFTLAAAHPSISRLLEEVAAEPSLLGHRAPQHLRRTNSGGHRKLRTNSGGARAKNKPGSGALPPPSSRPLPSYMTPTGNNIKVKRAPTTNNNTKEEGNSTDEPGAQRNAEEVPHRRVVPSSSVPATVVPTAPVPSRAPKGEGGGPRQTKELKQLIDQVNKNHHFVQNIDDKIWKQMLTEVVDMATGESLSSICGLENAKQILYESVVLPDLAPQFFTGLKAPPTGVLLFGPPGNGKTMLARALANERKSTFFNISAASLVSKWLGEGEKLVRALFGCARALEPTVIFLDECDSLLARRSSNEHEGTRRLKNEFLQQTDGIASAAAGGARVLVIGATNRPMDLDEAVLRRFPKRVHIPLPDIRARETLLQSLLKNEKLLLSEEEWDEIYHATQGYSAADLKELCKEMVMIPVRECLQSVIQHSGDPAADSNVMKHLESNLQSSRPVTITDFRSTVGIVRPTVQADQLNTLEKWNNAYGSNISNNTAQQQ